jgi:16S rRNA (guanine527-N7)-methyltransferase
VLTAQASLEERLKEGLQPLGVTPTGREIAGFVHLLRLLDQWNQAFNLTAVRDLDEMVSLHILDSISARPFLHGRTVLDVGTGAGFPGLPLAMLEPERQFALLDSGGKKVRFVRHAIGELDIGNVTVVQTRIEDYEPTAVFDTVMCRAFSTLGKFIGTCGRLAGADGRLLAMKGRYPDDELGSVPAGWEPVEIANVRIPGAAIQRHIAVFQRTQETNG